MFLVALLPVALAAPEVAAPAWAGAPVGCSAAVPPSTLARFLKDAELRLAELDDDGFAAAAQAAAAATACVGSPLSAADLAPWHRVMGVRAFTAGDEATAAAHFRAYVALAPDGELPSSYAGEGGKLVAFFRASVAERPTGAPRALLPPPGYRAVADGAPATLLPAGRAGVVQLLAAEDTVVTTWALDGDDPAPDLGSVLAKAVAPVVSTLPAPTAQRRPVGLAVATAVTAALAGGSYAASWVLRSRFDDVTVAPVATDDLAGLRTGTNATALAAPALGGVALALGIVTVVRW